MVETIPLFPGVPGGPELLVVLLLAVLLFGSSKIPKLARSTGEAMGEFKKGREEVEQELQDMQSSDNDIESQTQNDDFVDTEPITDDDSETATNRNADNE